MKILITETQLKSIIVSEQPESRYGPEQFMNHQERQDFRSGNAEKAGQALASGSQKQMDYIHSLDPHTVLETAQIAFAFVPVVGILISSGLGVINAGLYYKEGKKKEATIAAVMALLPGIGSVVTKIPAVKTLGTKGMSVLADKIAKGATQYTSLEAEAVQGINLNKQLIHSEMDGLVKRITTNVANKMGKQTISPIMSKAASATDNYVFNKTVSKGTEKVYDWASK